MTRSDPVLVFEAAVRALNDEDWQGVALQCDAVSMRAFKRELARQLAGANPDRPAGMPSMEVTFQVPGDIRPRGLFDAARHADPEWQLRRLVPTIATVAEFHALDALHVFAAWLDGRTTRRQLRHFNAVAGNNPDASDLDGESEASEIVDYYGFDVFGSVQDGPDTAIIVHRPNGDSSQWPWPEAASTFAELSEDEQQLECENQGYSQLGFTRCRRQSDGSWKLHVSRQFLGMRTVSF